MDQQPHGSPWGKVQSCDRLCRGVYCVSTAGHGGIMIQKGIARKILSVEARRIAVMDHGYACFEEDCAATVAYRELLDQGGFAKRLPI